jgi:tetratricopeptide (TPR) repeat protein
MTPGAPIASKLEKLLVRSIDLYAAGDLEAAESGFRKILKIEKREFNALHHLGLIALQKGDYGAAVVQIKKAIDQHPGSFIALTNLCVAYQKFGQLDEALAAANRALAIKSDHAEAYLNRGYSYLLLGKYEEGIKDFNKSIALGRRNYQPYLNRGIANQRLQKFDEALADADIALGLNPGSAQAFSLKGDALAGSERYAEALGYYDKALELNPNFVEACVNKGNALRDLGRFGEAVELHDQAIRIDPDFTEALQGRGMLKLLLGDYREGWRDHEFRKSGSIFNDGKSFKNPVWTGDTEITGKTIFVRPEQGLGDVIQFARYIRNLEKSGARILFDPYPKLAALMKTMDASFEIVAADDEALSYDYHCPLLSLPFAFGTTEENMPNDTPYLFAEPSRVEKWRSTIGSTGYRIGICWQGSKNLIDIGRSFPVAAFRTISRLPDVRLISLHKGAGEDQLAELPEGMVVEVLGEDFDSGEDAFLDTAAVMMCCDLVITSDTSVAHLAGALGVPVWVALKKIPDWRWLLERDDSPWYPTMRLFRQKKEGDWERVFAEIDAALVLHRTNQIKN